MENSKINKVSLKEQVRDILYEKIISGELEPGERLKVIPIANALNVSQAPVREAIQCLVTAGYLELIPNAGARVKQFSDEEVRDIYELRQLIEIGAVQSKRFRSDRAAELMAGFLQQMAQATASRNFKEYAACDTRFHRVLVECSDNKKMLETWDSLLVPRHVTAKIKSRGATLDDTFPLHEPLVEALRTNRTADAVACLIKHYAFLGV